MHKIIRSILPEIWKQNFCGFPIRFITSNNGNEKKPGNNAEVVAWVDTLGETDRQKIRYIQNEVSFAFFTFGFHYIS